MIIYLLLLYIFFALNVAFSQTSFNYGPTNFDVVKKINVGDQNVSNAFRASNLSSLKGVVGSAYRNVFFEIGMIYRNKDSVKTYLRYNGLNDEIEIALSKNATSTINAVKKSESISCKINKIMLMF